MNILDIIIGTPYWVWIVLAFILYAGVDALQPSTVSVWQLSVMPLIFITWSIYSLYVRCLGCPYYWVTWIIALLAGIVIGDKMGRKFKINALSNGFVQLEGTSTPLILSLSFFAVKYILGVVYAIHPELYTDTVLVNIDLIASGIISGIALGRFIYIYKFSQN